MRPLVALATFLTTTLALIAAAGAQGVYVPHDEVSAVWTTGGKFADASKPGMSVNITHRTDKTGPMEVHDKMTHIWYITDGDATFVLGGTLVGKTLAMAGTFVGTDLQGGQLHHLTKGDIIIIPAGTPHWWKEVSSSISYYAVNVELANQGEVK